ncbi:hypothetical protein UIS43_07325 [Nocardiopsis sp. LDBS0036]|uniref:hypothetical protein n=1 Tax=Nocardiopsis sp. LDBS0036 TaxID=3104276 RepID=UPI0035158A10
MRYLSNGVRCANPTDHADGWCRDDDCPGYTTPVPDPVRFARSGPHYNAPVNPEPRPLDSYDIATLDVTRSAVDAFLEAHRGFTRAQAESALKTMVEDFTAMGCWSRSGGGWLSMAARGYYAVITPDLTAVAGYGTSHAERTWAQVKAGVPSRGAAERRRRQRRRRRERRCAFLEAVGATITDEEVEGEWFTVITASGGRCVRLGCAGPVEVLSTASWHDVLRQADYELKLGIPIPDETGSGDTARERPSTPLSGRAAEEASGVVEVRTAADQAEHREGQARSVDEV